MLISSTVADERLTTAHRAKLAYVYVRQSSVNQVRQQLIAEIGLGNAGLVVSLDASRLARNNRDWHQLLELCSVFGVLMRMASGFTIRAPTTTACCWACPAS